MTWRTIMINPRRCCWCRRRAWLSRARYLEMRIHRRCLAKQMAWLKEAGFKVIEPVKIVDPEGSSE